MVLAREISVEESAMAGYGCGSGGEGDWPQVHAQMVAYVAALSGGARGAAGGGVWREHSYARATRRAPARHAPRTLLAPDTDSDSQDADAPLDVGSETSAPCWRPALPCDAVDDDDEAGVELDGDEEWESRVAALAPSAAHARLAVRAADILRDLRLARLAVTGAGRALRREQARAAAYKLRRALAPTWLWPAGGAGSAGGGGGGAAWLYSVLSAYLPRGLRGLLEEALDELRRAAPRLAARLPTPRRAPPPDPLTPPHTAIPASISPTGPLVIWVSAGRSAVDARWFRRLAALIPTRQVPAGGAPPRAPPDVWCAQHAAAARQALNDALAEAGSRPVFLAGFDAGAALCCALASGLTTSGAGGGAAEGEAPRVRGLALLAPPLVSAEGEETLDARAPLLVIAGGSAGASGGGKVGALEACSGLGSSGREARRLVIVGGADDMLRLPARVRQRAVPQAALDAAIVEEVVRWVHELADADAEDDNSQAQEPTGEVIDVDVEDDDEYAHLPSPWTPTPATPATTPATPATPAPIITSNIPAPQPIQLGTPPAPGSGTRAIEIVEGRVVSRVSGSTPLMLTPRRAPPTPATPRDPPVTPHAADIMQMPIVFADDDPAGISTTPATVADKTSPNENPLTVTTVTSGGGRGGTALKYTRVIVAKRGAGAGGGARSGPPPRAPLPRAPPPPAGPTARGGSRPVLVRRAMRVVGRVKSRPSKEHQ